MLLDLSLIIQIFVLINPLSSLPVLIGAYKSKLNVKKIAILSVLVAFILAIVIILFGPYLFGIFKISIDSFRIAGGVVLMLLGLETIRSKRDVKPVKKIDSIISIIATPLLTGPATISYLIIQTYELGIITLLLNIIGAFILVAIVFGIFSIMIPRINMKVVEISSKILGLFLTAIAIQMIATGIHNLLLIKP
jgi:multiple antibiotic resistance protein